MSILFHLDPSHQLIRILGHPEIRPIARNQPGASALPLLGGFDRKIPVQYGRGDLRQFWRPENPTFSDTRSKSRSDKRESYRSETFAPPHAAAPGWTAAAIRACYRAKPYLRRPRDKAIWATHEQQRAPTCPGRGILGHIFPNLQFLAGPAYWLDFLGRPLKTIGSAVGLSPASTGPSNGYATVIDQGAL